MKYAWRPDIADHRDRYAALPEKALPKTVSKIGATGKKANRIEDQGNLGSCTGNASTSALEIVLGLKTQLSRLMAYYNAREIDGSINEDSGAYIRDAVKGLMKVGVSSEDVWPYIIRKFQMKPSAEAYVQAAELVERLQGYEYARVTSLAQMKAALAQRLPVIFGFVVTEGFEDLPKSGFLGLPSDYDHVLGGHAVTAVGYSDKAKVPYIWVRNSYGSDWGLGGYFKMDQRWFTDRRRLVDDLWVIKPKARTA